MCRRSELSETIGLAAQPGCNPNNTIQMLRNVTRQIADSRPDELSEDDKKALLAAKDAAISAAIRNYKQTLADI
jgi:hypothetical protein